jgi:hypothetical protein
MDGEGGGYINTNVNLKTVKKHIRLILTHLFLLWTLRSLVSSRADYNNPDRTVLAFENWTFLWSNESLINFLRRRPFNYEKLDATSRVQDRLFERVPKERKFMVAVLLGIFCSITTAQIVEAHLEEVLATRTLKQAVAMVASYVRQVQPNSVEMFERVCKAFICNFQPSRPLHAKPPFSRNLTK